MPGKLNPARRRERGASLVEMALVMGILLLLASGVVDQGRTLHYYIVITNAAREGVRYGSLFSGDRNAVEGAVIQEAAGSGVSIAPADITINGLNAAPADPIEVQVTHTVNMLMGAFVGVGQIDLRSSTVMLVYAQ
jgi:Flp pilus assembly protein TadG